MRFEFGMSFGEIAAGGTATVHVGRLLGPLGFSRIVAIRRCTYSGSAAFMIRLKA